MSTTGMEQESGNRTSRATTFIAQAFLNFKKFTEAKQESLQRRATMARLSSVADLSSFSAPPAAAASPNVATLPTPEYPLVLRIPDTCTAESATVNALQQYYGIKWAEKVQTIVQQLGDCHNIRPSEALSAELLAVGRGGRMHGAGAAQGGGAATKRRLSSVELKKERTNDDIIRTLLHHEERHFYEEVLPSRFLEDYQICVALADGSLPNPEKHGAMSTGKTHQQQLVDAAENPRDWVIPPGSIVKQHPKAVFPYTLTIFYKPTKTSRTMNDIMSRSSSFVLTGTLYSGTSDANVSNLIATTSDRHSSSGGDVLRSAVQQVVGQNAPKNMLGDEAARRRGFTILSFLPALTAESYIDPQGAKLLRRVSEHSSLGGAPKNGSAQESIVDVEERDKDIDVTVEELMQQAGLTLYDVARHGNGPLANMGRENVMEQVPQLQRSDVERKRQENVIRAERAQIAREETSMRLAEKKELSLREQHTIDQAAARKLAERTKLDLAREELERDLAKEERRVALELRIAEYKAAAVREQEEQKQRQHAFMAQLEETLQAKSQRRQLDTTLEGERTKAETLSRLAGPLSLRLNDFRPKVKQLDQQQRQDQILSCLVGSLDDKSAADAKQYHQNTYDGLQARDAYQRKVQDELVVRQADTTTMDKKGVARDARVEDMLRQQALVSRPNAETSILQIAARPSTKYYCSTEEEARQREEARNRSFLDWKERRRVEVESSFMRKSLGMKAN